MPRIKPLLSLALLSGALALIACLGSRGGRFLARSGIVHPSGPSSARKPIDESGAAKDKAAEQELLRADLVETSIKRLKALAGNCPDLREDWETQAQMDGVIAKLSARELAEVFAATNFQLGDRTAVLPMKIGTAWMAQDPDAALKGLVEWSERSGYGGYLVAAVFGNWAGEAPEAALAWLNSAEFPADPPTLREQLRESALYTLAERDFDLATAEFLKITGPSSSRSDSQTIMSNWAALHSDDPVIRSRLIDFAKSTSNPKDYAELNAGLLQRWPQEDAMGMMSYLQELQSYLESDAVPAAARPQVDASAVGVAIFREYDGPALKWWMERYGDSRETPAPMKSAMADWMKKYPDKAMQWFQEQPAGLQRDSLTTSVIPSLITMKRFDDAAKSIENIQDPTLRQNSAQRLNILWSEQDAAAAKTWRESLPTGTLPD
ncbi:hypothetical protein [Haloferula sp. BvORR071]|uniref:hypothetical protein n=1 Tax=Haloferula sp. BvORR071 TaxID=1396141 RepID=UPI000554E168|nr:hypothetical protein [Haloferula sp. BvORR071]